MVIAAANKKRADVVQPTLVIGFVLLLTLSGCNVIEPKGSLKSVVNNTVWNDQSGNPIQTHDAIVSDGTTYYWYGLNYGVSPFLSVKCYSSTDLVNWTFRNNVLVSTSDSEFDFASVSNVRVVYNPNTQNWVMWFSYNTPLTTLNRYMVAYSSSPIGNFHVARNSSLLEYDPLTAEPQLFQVTSSSLVVDEDKTGYLFANILNADDDTYYLAIYKLNSDFLSVHSRVATIYPRKYIAPAASIAAADDFSRIKVVKDGDIYHLFFLHRTTSYNASSVLVYGTATTRHATAISITGPWSDLDRVGATADAYGSFSDVFQVQGTETTSWVVSMNENLITAEYAMLPLELNKETAAFEYYPNFHVNSVTGEIAGSN